MVGRFVFGVNSEMATLRSDTAVVGPGTISGSSSLVADNTCM